MVCHIIGSEGEIAQRPGARRSYLDCDKTHWRLYLGLSNDVRYKISELFKQNKCLSIECLKIVFDYFDVGFMAPLLNHRFMPYNYD